MCLSGSDDGEKEAPSDPKLPPLMVEVTGDLLPLPVGTLEVLPTCPRMSGYASPAWPWCCNIYVSIGGEEVGSKLLPFEVEVEGVDQDINKREIRRHVRSRAMEDVKQWRLELRIPMRLNWPHESRDIHVERIDYDPYTAVIGRARAQLLNALVNRDDDEQAEVEDKKKRRRNAMMEKLDTKLEGMVEFGKTLPLLPQSVVHGTVDVRMCLRCLSLGVAVGAPPLQPARGTMTSDPLRTEKTRGDDRLSDDGETEATSDPKLQPPMVGVTGDLLPPPVGTLEVLLTCSRMSGYAGPAWPWFYAIYMSIGSEEVGSKLLLFEVEVEGVDEDISKREIRRHVMPRQLPSRILFLSDHQLHMKTTTLIFPPCILYYLSMMLLLQPGSQPNWFWTSPCLPLLLLPLCAWHNALLFMLVEYFIEVPRTKPRKPRIQRCCLLHFLLSDHFLFLLHLHLHIILPLPLQFNLHRTLHAHGLHGVHRDFLGLSPLLQTPPSSYPFLSTMKYSSSRMVHHYQPIIKRPPLLRRLQKDPCTPPPSLPPRIGHQILPGVASIAFARTGFSYRTFPTACGSGDELFSTYAFPIRNPFFSFIPATFSITHEPITWAKRPTTDTETPGDLGYG
ncbi:hypothetical protein HU200_037474 [Digitaria exilis]|uniref:Uncharacterized protein n=1 Tax=Digitaria exilis TaxID=1010633 RepID=A0A835BLN0_9POAL|nr:hypothetical protein HU200_037474 [Digitaria exilis]